MLRSLFISEVRYNKRLSFFFFTALACWLILICPLSFCDITAFDNCFLNKVYRYTSWHAMVIQLRQQLPTFSFALILSLSSSKRVKPNAVIRCNHNHIVGVLFTSLFVSVVMSHAFPST